MVWRSAADEGEQMRTPRVKQVPKIEPKATNTITQTRQYELITPLFGGGVMPGEVDPVTPIRGTEVRGQLRFWWRATRAGQFNGNLTDMKKYEDELWGAAADATTKTGQSEVKVAVEVTFSGEPDRPFEVVPNKHGKPQVRPQKGSIVPAYAAFPLQPPQKEATVGMETKSVQVGIRFNLTIAFPDNYRSDVEAALWAWETFGGLGARTRRGFGALRCTKINDKPIPLSGCGQLKEAISASLKQHLAPGKVPDNVPYLDPALPLFKVTDRRNDATVAWNDLIRKLNSFRQARRGSRFGPSLWPEPNAIRSIMKVPSKGDSNPVDKFPRAQFGLPIIFHFPQDRSLDDATLTGENDIERFSSPLILRPLVCEGGAVGVAVCLAGPTKPPGNIVLHVQGKPETVQTTLSNAEAKRIEPLKGNKDVLKAFLDTL
jgi:CRISPR-associated protein Cmr1